MTSGVKAGPVILDEWADFLTALEFLDALVFSGCFSFFLDAVVFSGCFSFFFWVLCFFFWMLYFFFDSLIFFSEICLIYFL